jgi:hypothetical protein
MAAFSFSLMIRTMRAEHLVVNMPAYFTDLNLASTVDT